jgi:hypothetical protein
MVGGFSAGALTREGASSIKNGKRLRDENHICSKISNIFVTSIGSKATDTL